MQENIKELQKEFKRIKNMGWIRERRHGFCAIGYTFEQMLGKEEENFPVPDFNGIEIKTRNYHSTANLHLFNLIPDGDYLFPIKRIITELGLSDKKYKDYKIFYRSFNCSNYTSIIYGRRGILKVNYVDKKVELIVLNHKNENINIGISWSFDWIEERLLIKLQYLALVYAKSRIINGNGYYYYDQIKFYKLKDFNNFLSLLEDGLIEVTFKIDFFRSGRRFGQIYDHGTDFSIRIKDINLLYDEISS